MRPHLRSLTRSDAVKHPRARNRAGGGSSLRSIDRLLSLRRLRAGIASSIPGFSYLRVGTKRHRISESLRKIPSAWMLEKQIMGASRCSCRCMIKNRNDRVVPRRVISESEFDSWSRVSSVIATKPRAYQRTIRIRDASRSGSYRCWRQKNHLADR